ncbi:ATP-binding cassette domain-containing protein [Microbacterium jepli]|uniref:ATP-binding cassette domain-containing protein n=1 Tax=Microbacterium sp. 1P10UE TaxID=3132288 RepID=UPI00399F6968
MTSNPVLAIDSVSGAGGAVIDVESVSKAYGHVTALSNVSCQVHPGEVVALVGDNGAGKSTLMKVMCGVIQPDEGRVTVQGRDLPRHGAIVLSEYGVGVVYQDLALAPDLSVHENFFLGNEPTRSGFLGALGFLDRKRMAAECRAALDRLGIKTLKSVEVELASLSGGQRQSVAIARAVNWASSAVVMDEPTAALGVHQTQLVGDMIKSISARGIAVLLISHDMPAVLELADRILVMRHGRLVADLRAAEADIPQIVSAMLGSTDVKSEEA